MADPKPHRCGICNRTKCDCKDLWFCYGCSKCRRIFVDSTHIWNAEILEATHGGPILLIPDDWDLFMEYDESEHTDEQTGNSDNNSGRPSSVL